MIRRSLAAIVLVIGIAGRMVLYSLRTAPVSSRNSKNSGGFIVVIAAVGLALLIIGYVGYFFGRLIQAAVSRQREFLADASSVQFTRNPGGLVGALRKIGGYALGSSIQSSKGTAFGPMADVVASSTQHLTDDDLHAVATYLASLPPRPQPQAPGMQPFNAAALVKQGEKVYAQHCADCHGKDGNGVAGIYPALRGNSSVTEPSGIDATRVVLLGGFAPLTAANPRPYSMPPFAQQLSDADVAAVVSYIRHAWKNDAPVVMERDVSRYRQTPVD